jgi:UDP-GlcNAc:undecaprenyl-phosphate GlcNAc-1-phosphate transferase
VEAGGKLPAQVQRENFVAGPSERREHVRLTVYALAIGCLLLVAFPLSSSPGPYVAILSSLWAIVSSFSISFLLTDFLIARAPALGLIDQPSARKVHTQPTPRAGGLAIYSAMVISSIMTFTERGVWLTLVLGLLIVVLGLVDDLRPLPWQLRLAVQAGVAVVAVYFWQADVHWLIRAAAVFWIVGLINAFNMLDNMDALSGGVAWIAAGGFAAFLLLRPEIAADSTKVWPYLLLMAALLGFLCFNRPPARIFMGDAGSTFLGFFLAVGSLHDVFTRRAPPQNWLVPVCILAVPWYDLVCVVTLRIWQGHSPFHADKQHISHRLVQRGLPSPTAVRVIYLLGLASGLAGLVLDQLAPLYAWLLAGQFLCWWLAVAAIEYFPHYRLREISSQEPQQLA